MFISNKVKLYVPQESTGLTGWLGQLSVSYTECKFVLHTNSPRQGGMIGTMYPEFPYSSATFNIISGSRILASAEVLQGVLGNSTWPMQCSQLPNASQ